MIGFKKYLLEQNVISESVRSAEQFRLTNENAEWLYDVFTSSYLKITGEAFSKQLFFSRASDWTFFGVPPITENDAESGFVAVRFQRSGLVKLTGVAGSPKSILKGIDLLNSLDLPVWGAVSASIAKMAEKKGFKIVPPEMLKNLASHGVHIPGMEIDSSGNIKANIQEIGVVDKVAIVNDKYIGWLKVMYPNLDI